MADGKIKIPIPADQRAQRPGNIAYKARRRFWLIQIVAAFTLGALLSLAFAPAESAFVAWFGLLPILYLGLLPNSRPWLLGYTFGFGHFTTTFSWLREVFILAPVGIAAVCSIFPALWLFLSKCLFNNLQISKEHDLLPRNDPSIIINTTLTPLKTHVVILGISFIWCGLEWCRSWFLSGFPWNQLGISQWQNLFVLPLSCYTGVYGISFIIVVVNATIYIWHHKWIGGIKTETRSSVLGILLPVLVSFTLVWFVRDDYLNVPEKNLLKVAAVQGNIPQSRQWNPEQLNLALEVYTALTRDIVRESKPDLIIWPETAIPASLTNNEQCILELQKLFEQIKTPMIAGSIHYRFAQSSHNTNEPSRTYNSALLFDASGQIVNSYDKIHLVPFGEYVPFEEYFPWLVEWIGMGRSLVSGREYTVIPFTLDAMIGINICFEDVFPEISSRMVRAGANLLVVITNDAWFGETSGSRQHLAHTVFRAVENFRPVLRNGNNSDTCLILPNGEIKNLLYDIGGKDRFIRQASTYSVPIRQNLPQTFYTRHGNWFAILSFLIALVCATWCFYRFLDRKRRLYELLRVDNGIRS